MAQLRSAMANPLPWHQSPPPVLRHPHLRPLAHNCWAACRQHAAAASQRPSERPRACPACQAHRSWATPNSQLPTPNSQLPTPNSQLPANSPRPATCKQARPSGAFFPTKASPTSSPRAGKGACARSTAPHTPAISLADLPAHSVEQASAGHDKNAPGQRCAAPVPHDARRLRATERRQDQTNIPPRFAQPPRPCASWPLTQKSPPGEPGGLFDGTGRAGRPPDQSFCDDMKLSKRDSAKRNHRIWSRWKLR